MVALAKTNCSAREDIVEIINPSGKGGFVLACEHASNFIPPQFENLGLGCDVLQSHVAWDPGALAVAEVISAQLDAPLVAQRISRLVYDCNRPPTSDSAMPAKSEIFDIPGNVDLSPTQRQARIDQYYVPFQQTLATRIDEHIENNSPPVLMTIHSFTPTYQGMKRDLDIGVLHDRDSRFADELLNSLGHENCFKIARNAPYGPADGVTHTLVQHALPRGLMNVMIEIRNNIISTPASQLKMGEYLARHVSKVLAGLKADTKGSGL